MCWSQGKSYESSNETNRKVAQIFVFLHPFCYICNQKTNTMTKIHLEYPLVGNSRNIVWDFIGTTGGLEAWMADKIVEKGDVYTFQWEGGETRDAELLGRREGVYIRFRWLDEGPKTHFELRINVSELTKAYVLEITEISRNEDEEDLTQMWESQMEELRRVAGL